MSEQRIRVRFAPSPTGPLHIGGVRTALYNFLFAKQHGGSMILRIEDTDQNRFVEGAEQYILDAFDWCGIAFDEGVVEGGPFGPYRQSERKDIYKQYAFNLVQSGHAYYAFDTAADLEDIRKKNEAEKKTFIYNAAERQQLRNSLTLGQSEIESLLKAETPYVIRFKMPVDKLVVMHDLIRDKIEVNSNVLDDKILFKSDGMPTYHLANIVDDHLMEISHVIRGEEWLPSLPLHVLLYEAFGWTAPAFAHLPLLLKPEGNGKLSKRDGDRLGFPVFPLAWKDPRSGEISSGYREEGYFADAFINMLALLGWNPGDQREFFTLPELTKAFSLDRVGKSGSKFDPGKARWFNHHYLQTKNNRLLAEQFDAVLKEKEIDNFGLDFTEKVVQLVKERVNFVREIWDEADFFYSAPKTYDPKAVKKRWKDTSYEEMGQLKEVLKGIGDFTAEQTESVVKEWIEKKELNMGAIMNAFRLLVVGALKGPHLFDIISLIGKEETLKRLDAGMEALGSN